MASARGGGARALGNAVVGGKIVSGVLRKGQRVAIVPAGVVATVRAIEATGGGAAATARRGDAFVAGDAVDVARVLAKTENEMSVTDLAPYAGEAIQASPIEDIYIFGRRGPVEGAFTNVELREMGHLENCVPVLDAAQIPDEVVAPHMSDRDLRLRTKNVDTLRSFLDVSPEGNRSDG